MVKFRSCFGEIAQRTLDRYIRAYSAMPGDYCIVCGNTPAKDPDMSFHRFPLKGDPKRKVWLCEFGLDDDQVKSYSQICLSHFPDSNISNNPQKNLGKRFASPRKKGLPRSECAKWREAKKQLFALLKPPTPSSSRSTTPALDTTLISSTASALDLDPALTVGVGEQLCSEYQVHELPSDTTDGLSECLSTSLHSLPESSQGPSQCTEVIVNTALLACVETLEAEN